MDVKRTFLSKDMSKQIEFNVEYSPEHELAAEKAVSKQSAFEITSETIRKVQNVGRAHALTSLADRDSRCRDSSRSCERGERVVLRAFDRSHSSLARKDCVANTVGPCQRRIDRILHCSSRDETDVFEGSLRHWK